MEWKPCWLGGVAGFVTLWLAGCTGATRLNSDGSDVVDAADGADAEVGVDEDDAGWEADVIEDVGEDVPTDEHGDTSCEGLPDGEYLLPPCDAPIALACGDHLVAETTAGGENFWERYFCNERHAYAGPDRTYRIPTSERRQYRITLHSSAGVVLNVFGAPASCDGGGSDQCGYGTESGDATVTFVGEGCASYYVFVDGDDPAGGSYDLDVWCGPSEICDNGSDDDGDGDTDCCDRDCFENPACVEDCTNGIDDDCDGLVDCRDWSDCHAAEPSCTEDCSNDIDDDLNGLTDCQDPQCITSPACAEDCTNGVDDNGDGLTDCDDPRCVVHPACAENCSNGIDDNHDGWTDCRDPRCVADPACMENCSNGIDDNWNGLIDCADPACARSPYCFETFCGDGADDDGDGATDCADFDCIGDPACAGGPGLPGAPCSTHDACASGACLNEVVSGAPGGNCLGGWSWTERCADFACPAGTICHCFNGDWPMLVDPPCACYRRCDATDPCGGDLLTCVDTGDTAPPDGVPDTCYGYCANAEQCTTTHACVTEASPLHGLCAVPREVCTGGIDEDGDTLTDCADIECVFTEECGSAPTFLQGASTCSAATPLTMPAGDRGTVVVWGMLAWADGDDHQPACEPDDSVDVVYRFVLSRRTRLTMVLWGGYAAGDLWAPVLSTTRGCAVPDILCSGAVGWWTGPVTHVVESVLEPGTYYAFVDAADEGHGRYSLGVHLADP